MSNEEIEIGDAEIRILARILQTSPVHGILPHDVLDGNVLGIEPIDLRRSYQNLEDTDLVKRADDYGSLQITDAGWEWINSHRDKIKAVMSSLESGT